LALRGRAHISGGAVEDTVVDVPKDAGPDD